MSSSKESIYYQIFTDYPDVVSVAQLSDMLGINPKTAYQLLHENKIEHFVIGRTYKIPKINVLKYMALKV